MLLHAFLNFLHPSPKRQILESSKLKESADDNFKVDENRKKVSKQEREIARYVRAISPLPTVFSKDLCCRHVKTRVYLGN